MLDNLPAHKAPAVRAALKATPAALASALQPTSSSRLNLVEAGFRELTQKTPPPRQLRAPARRDHTLAEHWNDSPKCFIWRAEADTIIAKTRRGRDALTHNTNSTSDH